MQKILYAKYLGLEKKFKDLVCAGDINLCTSSAILIEILSLITLTVY